MSNTISSIKLASILGCENEEEVLYYDLLINRLQKINIKYDVDDYDYDSYHSQKDVVIVMSAIIITARYYYWNLRSSCSDGYELDVNSICVISRN